MMLIYETRRRFPSFSKNITSFMNLKYLYPLRKYITKPTDIPSRMLKLNIIKKRFEHPPVFTQKLNKFYGTFLSNFD
eukprot:UN24977